MWHHFRLWKSRTLWKTCWSPYCMEFMATTWPHNWSRCGEVRGINFIIFKLTLLENFISSNPSSQKKNAASDNRVVEGYRSDSVTCKYHILYLQSTKDSCCLPLVDDGACQHLLGSRSPAGWNTLPCDFGSLLVSISSIDVRELFCFWKHFSPAKVELCNDFSCCYLGGVSVPLAF